MPQNLDQLVAALPRGAAQPVYLVHGELVLAEPAAGRLAGALAQAAGCAVETHRRPAALSPLLGDLRTFSLFASAKVLLAVDTAALADRSAAADLVDDAAEVLPLHGPGLGGREREAASRLLQALRLFDLDPHTGAAEEALQRLPAWALEGGSAWRRNRRPRTKKQAEELRGSLAALLEAARQEGLQGVGAGELPDLAEAIRAGLPPGHSLVLAERTVTKGHPVLELLEERGAVVAVGELAAGRGGAWEGLDLLAAELERQTGVGIARDALAELARRTLRQEGDWRKGEARGGGADADSTARFAGEYRKLAGLATGGKIDRKLVERAVEDRGEEDVWKLLDAMAEGRGGEALDRLARLLAAADDPLAARLSFFSLLATFCRRAVAVRGMMRLARVPAGEASFPRFKSRWAPALQGETGAGKNPLAGVKEYPLFRAYLAASRLPEPFLARLPADVLDAELQLKGDSGDPDAALAGLVARVAAAAKHG